ncbi:glycoside hydrolase family 2 protein [Chitinophaga eiseniae]|uniref:Glycoside hydrolase family 2 n=1 Tax=Chitinophaga eiseniae TaxID=634771 RepID=A0A847SWH9_9BACT|nr:sugar-binding domain-containing protein [Chitinophaga eiseniae]NLR81432.1 glycoside hydrolase family 2 [Chitinophaga eiseniae]
MKLKLSLFALSTLSLTPCLAQIKKNIDNNIITVNYQTKPIRMATRWAKDVSPMNVLKEYPRPQLQRNSWINLNGPWDYCITDSSVEMPNSFEGTILVPFPIESALSGVQKQLDPDKRLWYRKIIPCPVVNNENRILLNFGAVDWLASVFINGKKVGQHSGGYQSFGFDITDFLLPGNNEILVKVYDPTDQGPNPHGKQALHPQNIYYTPSSGIWQTVWMETVSSTHITYLKATPDIDQKSLHLDIVTQGDAKNCKLEIKVLSNDKIINTVAVPIIKNQGNTTINIPNARLWSPDDPFLYDLSVQLTANGSPLDLVKSYFGMRKINIQKDDKGMDRIFLNNKYTYNLGVLDQGFWPDGLYTAPTDDALSFDIKAIKSLGFNTIRKHIKIEPERWYYYADKIGVLVWQDFVNPPYNLPDGSRAIFEKEIRETMDQLHNHPSIVTWVLFNERWGAYDQQRLTDWVKKYDTSRILNAHSGELLFVNDELREPSETPWIHSDIADVHSYPNPRIPVAQPNQARVLGEFGGVGVSVPNHEWNDIQGWGYVQVNPGELKKRYTHMMEKLRDLERVGLSASIYTQPFDVEGEENGLLTYDRAIIKIPVSEIRDINKKLVNQSGGFTSDSSLSVVMNIDTSDNDNKYEELLAEYKNGGRDSSLLRRLVLMALRKKDQNNACIIGNDYFDILADPYSKENLIFLLQTARTDKDRGFIICRDKPELVDTKLGKNSAIRKIEKVIDAENIAPIYRSNPNWDEIQQRVRIKYGNLGEEYVLGRRMIYYGFESSDWKNFGKYYVLYFKRALTHPTGYSLNNVTWVLYEHVSDPEVLKFARDVMKYAIENLDNSAEAYDTYAQLLHRTNQSKEAIKWEEKALNMIKGTPNEKTFAETLQKMKAGQPTWPPNN